MRRVQASIRIHRFGKNAPNGTQQKLSIYADANNEYEALCSAFYEALDAIQATDGEFPSFGRRSSSDNIFPKKADVSGADPHHSEAVCSHVLKVGDITTSYVARHNSPDDYIVLGELFSGPSGRTKGGRVVGFSDSKEEIAEMAIKERTANPGGIAILTSSVIPHDCRIFSDDMALGDFVDEVRKWAARKKSS